MLFSMVCHSGAAMMKMFFLVVVSVLVGQSALAANGTYRCTHVGGVEEYTIEVNLNSHKAAFFDNDSWSVIGLKSTSQLETLPPQLLYVFQGRDAYDGVIKIEFNASRMSASVTEGVGSSRESRMAAEGGCTAIAAEDLGSEI